MLPKPSNRTGGTQQQKRELKDTWSIGIQLSFDMADGSTHGHIYRTTVARDKTGGQNPVDKQLDFILNTRIVNWIYEMVDKAVLLKLFGEGPRKYLNMKQLVSFDIVDPREIDKDFVTKLLKEEGQQQTDEKVSGQVG